ncbi:hemagglutinin repeat-containing protein [Megasphaera stantonii]|uniref:hemagglutinin repeat-containing protein n=1 Tax=Megasphaera stantonii TaxID=2144175 RepID=UPI003209B259
MTATDSVQLSAQHDVVMENTVTHLANQDILNRTAGIAVTGADGVLLVEAGHNIDLAGATLQALGDNGAVILNAGNDVNLTTQTLSAKKDMTLNSDNYLRTQRQTEVGTSIDAKGGVSIKAGQDINARAAYINSDDGTVAMAAGRDINLTTGREIAVDDFGLKHKESGLLSSSTTTIRTHDDHQTVLGATITGKEVQMGAVQDVNMTAAAVAGQNDVTVAAGRNVTTTSDMQYDKATAYTKVKSSGVLGAGLGIMIGTQKMQDNYEGEFKTQIGTTIGSSEGSVTMAAGDTGHLTTTDIIGKTGIDIAAQNIILDGKQNEAHERQTHEESLSGLTISLSSPVITAAEGVRSTIRTAQTRDNKTLQALEAYEGGKTLNDQIHAMKQDGIGPVGIHVGIGSSSFKQEYQNDTVIYAGGTLASEGNITIAAGSEDTAKGNIQAIGETIQGQNVTLAASHDIDLGAGTNTQTIRNDYSSKGASLGVTISGGAITGVDGSFHSIKDKGTTAATTHTGTTVSAEDTLSVQSGKDTTITGSQISGHTVKADVGGNLHITSLQDTNVYEGDSSSISGGFSKKEVAPNIIASGSSLSAGTGAMDSDYASVTQQAGIYAGKGGFTVHVEDNTQLKGAVIASRAEANKNELDTGSLTMENIENKAEYSADSKGITLSSANANKNNPLGASASMGIPMQGEAGSTTYAAIADGIIKVAGKETQEQINHDTEHALNQLGEIFNRKDVEERQELAGLVSKEGFTLIGDLAVSKQKELLQKAMQADKEGNTTLAKQYLQEASKWQEGGEYKVLLHGVLGGVLSFMTGNGFTAGVTSAGLNEALQKELGGIGNSELHKLASALVGQVVSHSGAGAAIAMDATEYNWLTHSDQMNLLKDYNDFISLQHSAGMDTAKNEYLKKFAYYLALTDYEMGYSQLYGTSNHISEAFYDAVNAHDPAAMDYNLGIQFRELINNLVVQYYNTPEELDEISALRNSYYQSFMDGGRVWKDLAAGSMGSSYASPMDFTNVSDDELLAKLPWGYQANGQKYVILPDNSTMLTDRYMNEGDALVAAGNISYVNQEGITVVDDGYGNTYYTMTEPILKNYGDKLAHDGGQVVEGADGNHYVVGADGKYYYTVYPVNVHDTEWHLKDSAIQETVNRGVQRGSEELAKIAANQSVTTTVQEVRQIGKYVNSKVGFGLTIGGFGGDLWENHWRYSDLNNEIKADLYDVGVIGVGIEGGALGYKYAGVLGGIIGAAGSSAVADEIAEKQKQILEEKEKKDEQMKKQQSNRRI